MSLYRSPSGLDYEQRVKDLMEAWAPPHAKELMKQGWRLSDGQGLTWVRNDKPDLLLPDEIARSLHYRRKDLISAIQSAGDYRDSDLCDELEKRLEELPTYEEAGRDRSNL